MGAPGRRNSTELFAADNQAAPNLKMTPRLEGEEPPGRQGARAEQGEFGELGELLAPGGAGDDHLHLRRRGPLQREGLLRQLADLERAHLLEVPAVGQEQLDRLRGDARVA